MRRRSGVAGVKQQPQDCVKPQEIREDLILRYLRSNSVNEDDQPTTSFPRLPYPSAQDAAQDASASGPPADPPEPPRGWRARRRARRDQTAAETGGTPGDATAAMPAAEAPEGGIDLPGPGDGTEPLDVPEPLASSTRGLRRQRKRLLQRREEMIFHLGGLAYELHVIGELPAPVAARRAGMISSLDSTVEAIDAQLLARGKSSTPAQHLPIVVGSCRTCHTLFVADARYCMKCGLALAPPDPAERST